MYRLTDYGAMLRDRLRVDAFRRALAAVITPSSVVLDLGTGVGTFAILAAKFGAARVYAVDSSDVLVVAAQNARTSGVAERIRFLDELELPERVDVLVSDLGGALPLFERHIPSIIDARDRFLKPGGAQIPQRDRLFCAPVSSEELHTSIVEPWQLPDVDFTPALAAALSMPHARRVEPNDLAGEPQVWAELDYATIDSPDVSGAVSWAIDKPVHALALWFESTLRDGISFSSGPWSHDSVHATMLLPFAEPLHDSVRATICATLVDDHYVVTWRSGVASHVVARNAGDDLLLFDSASATYHALNETGARVWRALERGEEVDAIVSEIARDYEVDAQQVESDVAAIVARLHDARLIETLPPPRIRRRS